MSSKFAHGSKQHAGLGEKPARRLATSRHLVEQYSLEPLWPKRYKTFSQAVLAQTLARSAAFSKR